MARAARTPLPPSEPRTKRERLAREAVAAALAPGFVSGTWNRRSDSADACVAGVRGMRPPVFTTRDDWMRARLQGATANVPQLILEIAAYARSRSCGNCGEMAALTFDYLWRRNERPIDYVQFTPMPDKPRIDHAFVLLGRTPGAALDAPDTWGADCWIVDAWIAGYLRHELKRAPTDTDGITRAPDALASWSLNPGEPHSLNKLFSGRGTLSLIQ